MSKILTIVSVGLIGVSEGLATTLATHVVSVTKDGQRSQLVSVPTLRVASSQGRLDAVTASPEFGGYLLRDVEGAFSVLEDGSNATFIARISSGERAGWWFLLGEVSAGGTEVAIDRDGLGGNAAELLGDEAFFGAPPFSLSELFPEQTGIFPASFVDLFAMQLKFFDGEEFSRIWLSDGTITPHVGWTYSADSGSLGYAGDTAILPGTSFVAVSPNAEGNRSIRVNGMVPSEGLSLQLYPGYNYVGYELFQELGSRVILLRFSMERVWRVAGSRRLLALAGLTVCLYSSQSRGPFFQELQLVDGSFQVWGSGGDAVDVVGPSSGFVIYNSGESFRWDFGGD